MNDHPQARRVEKISALLDLVLAEAKSSAAQSDLGEFFLEVSRVNRLLALREKAWLELHEPQSGCRRDLDLQSTSSTNTRLGHGCSIRN